MQRLFEHILELADDEESLVCVLVDEVSAETLLQHNKSTCCDVLYQYTALTRSLSHCQQISSHRNTAFWSIKTSF